MTVTAVLLPRFALVSALGGRSELIKSPLAIAPEPGGVAVIGPVSGQAEAHGVRPGMRLGEALGRCPELVLVPADPERTARAWEDVLSALEGMGAGVFSERPGEAYFNSDGLRGLWGGDTEGVLQRARQAAPRGARIAAAPSRFCAFAAASNSRPGRPAVVHPGLARAFLAPLPVTLLAGRTGRDLPDRLEKLGVRTMGAFEKLGRDHIADRFGAKCLIALRLAGGDDEPIRARQPREALAAELDLPDALSGGQLERAVELLIDRLLADPQRRGRAIRRLKLSARLASGGGWRKERTLRRAGSSQLILRLALSGAIDELPAPASSLRLEAVELAAPTGEQLSLSRPDEERRGRLSEAVRQVRAAAGRESVLKVLDVDPHSRLPERRAALTPFVPGPSRT
jgi:protein ImuB